MINWFLGVALCAAPFFLKTAPMIAPSESQAYFLLLASIVGVSVLGVRVRHLEIIILAVLAVGASLMATSPYSGSALYQFVMCSAGIAFVAVVASSGEKIRNLNLILGTVCLLQSAWILMGLTGFDIYHSWLNLIGFETKAIWVKNHAVITGSLGNISHSSALVAATMPFIRPKYWAIPVAALVVAGSAMATLGAIVSAVALYSYKKRKMWPLAVTFAALFCAAIVAWFNLIPRASYFTPVGRIEAWKAMLDWVGVQFTGQGLGSIREVFGQNLYNGEHFLQMHNEWLEAYAVGGILAVIALAWCVRPVFKNVGNPQVNACLLSLLTNSLGNFTFHIAPLFMVFGACYGFQLSRSERWHRQ